MKYFHSYVNKKPAILLMEKDSIPPGMTIREIADLFEKSEPIPYAGEESPRLVEVPKELNGRNERAEKPFKPVHSL
jgi:hypothetical protein